MQIHAHTYYTVAQPGSLWMIDRALTQADSDFQSRSTSSTPSSSSSESQTLAVPVNSRGTGTVTARRNRTAGAQANGLSRHRVGGRGWRRTVTVTCASEKPAMLR